MNIGIIIETNNPESSWNAVRFGITALKKNHIVKILYQVSENKKDSRTKAQRHKVSQRKTSNMV